MSEQAFSVGCISSIIDATTFGSSLDGRCLQLDFCGKDYAQLNKEQVQELIDKLIKWRENGK